MRSRGGEERRRVGKNDMRGREGRGDEDGKRQGDYERRIGNE